MYLLKYCIFIFILASCGQSTVDVVRPKMNESVLSWFLQDTNADGVDNLLTVNYSVTNESEVNLEENYILFLIVSYTKTVENFYCASYEDISAGEEILKTVYVEIGAKDIRNVSITGFYIDI